MHLESDRGWGTSLTNAELSVVDIGGKQSPQLERFERDLEAFQQGVTSGQQIGAINEVFRSLLGIPLGLNLTPRVRQTALEELIQAVYQVQLANGQADIPLDQTSLSLNFSKSDDVGTTPGDATLDGRVDGLDFGIWNANAFTRGTSWLTADFNFDGVTDVRDYNVWNQQKFIVTSPKDGETGSSILRVPRAAGPTNLVAQPNFADEQLAVDTVFSEPLTRLLETPALKSQTVEMFLPPLYALPTHAVERIFSLIDAGDRLGQHAEADAEDTDSPDLHV